MDQWAKLLQATLTKEDTVPEGWFTSEQLATKYHRSQRTIIDHINHCKEQVECRMFRVRHGDKVYATPHYHIIKGKAPRINQRQFSEEFGDS